MKKLILWLMCLLGLGIPSLHADTYKLVKSVGDITVGDEYVLVHTSSKAGMGTFTSTNKFMERVSNLTIGSDETIVVDATHNNGLVPFTIVDGTVDGTVAFKISNSSYIANTSNANGSLTNSTSLVANCNISIGTMSSSDYSVVLKFVTNAGNEKNQFQYNSNSGQERFTNYKSANQKDCQLYKKQTTGGDVTAPSTGSGDTYVLVTSTSDIDLNGEYILVATHSGTYSALGFGTSSRNAITDFGTFNNNSFVLNGTNSEQVARLTFENGSTGGTYTIKDNTNNYLGYSSGTNFKTQASDVTIAFDGNNAKIIYSGQSRGIIYRLSTYNIFRPYSTGSTFGTEYFWPSLYKKLTGPVDPTYYWSGTTNGAFTVKYDATNPTYPTVAIPSGLTAAFTSSNTSVAEIGATTGAITLKGIGTTTIKVSTGATSAYNAGEASYTLTVDKGDAIVVWDGTTSDAFTATKGADAETAWPIASVIPDDLAITYSSSNPAVASIDGATGAITTHKAGTTIITANVASTSLYNGDEASYTLTVVYAVNGATEYTKMLKDDTFAAGDKIILVQETGYRAMNRRAENNNLKSTSVTISDERVIDPAADVVVLTLVESGTEGQWYLQSQNGRYLSSTASAELKLADEPMAVTLSLNNQSNVQVTLSGSSNPVRINNTNGNYSCFSSGSAIQAYRLSKGVPAVSKDDANLAWSGGYSDSNPFNFTLTVSDAANLPSLTYPSDLTLTNTANAAKILVTSSNALVASVNADGTITPVSSGTTIITASISGNGTYNDTSVSYKLIVENVIATIPMPEIKLNDTATTQTTLQMLTTDMLEIEAATGVALTVTAIPEANASIVTIDNSSMIEVTDDCALNIVASKSGLEDLEFSLTVTVPVTTLVDGETLTFSDGENTISGNQTINSGQSIEVYAVSSNNDYIVTITADPSESITFDAEENGVSDLALVTVTAPCRLSAVATLPGHKPSAPVTLTYQYPLAQIPTINSFPDEVIYTDDIVTMSCSTPGAVIHYTLDGSEPTAESALYEAGFTLPVGAHTIKAIAFADGYRDSNVRTVELTVAAAPTFTADDLKYRLVTSTDDIVTVEGHNNYILVNNYVDPTAAMGVGSTKRRAVTDFATKDDVTDFATKDAAGDLKLTKNVSRFTITASANEGSYLFHTDEGYLTWNGQTGTAASLVNEAVATTYSDIQIVDIYTKNDVKALRTKFTASTGDGQTNYALGANNTMFDAFGYTTINNANASQNYYWPSLYRRVETGEPMAPAVPEVTLGGSATVESNLTVLTTQTLTIAGESDATFTVTAEPAANANITLTGNTATITFTGDCSVTATISRDNINGQPMTATKVVNVTVPAVAPIKFFKEETELTDDPARVAPNTVVTITTSTEGALLSYSTDGGETWSDPAASASVTVEADKTVAVRATKEGYITAEATKSFIASSTVTDRITYEQTLPESNGYHVVIWNGPDSDAQYFARTYRENASTNYIQLNNNNGWIMTLASGGTLKSISYEIETSKQPTSNVTINVYGVTTPFEGTQNPDSPTSCPSFDTTNHIGTKQVSKTNNISGEIEITDTSFEYFIIKTTGAVYFKNIDVTWSTAPDTQAKQPTITVAGKRGANNEIVALTAADYTVNNGTTIYHVPIVVTVAPGRSDQSVRYKFYNSDDWLAPSDSKTSVTLDITEPTPLVAKGVAEGLDDSEELSTYYSLAPKQPTHTITENNTGLLTTKTVNFACATEDATIWYRVKTPGGIWSDWQEGESVTITNIGENTFEVKASYGDWADSLVLSEIVTIDNPNDNKAFILAKKTSLLNDGMQVILVDEISNTAVAPWTGGNNFSGSDVTITTDGTTGNKTIQLAAKQKSVEIFTLVKEGEKYRLKTNIGTGANNGYLASTNSSDKNNSRIVSETSTLDGYSLATISIDENSPYDATIKFDSGSRNYFKRNTSSNIYSCYSSGQRAVKIFYRDQSSAIERPTVSLDEGFYTAEELAQGVTISCATEGAVIYYTTDGTDPYTNPARLTYDGETIPLSDGSIIQAIAQFGGISSPIVICNYHVYTGDKVYTRVTKAELQNLKLGDQVIIVASPTGTNDYYALGRNQYTDYLEGRNAAHREAVKLSTNELTDIDNGRITIENTHVQPITLLSGVDHYNGYDWRLYTSGVYDNVEHPNENTPTYDGYLYSAGSDNTLETKRLMNPDNSLLANADIRFHSIADDGIGNEYGGVTVQFGSPDGHEESYPNHMGLRYLDNVWRFNCYTLEQIEGTSGEYADPIYHISIFKLYDPEKTPAPVFSTLNRLTYGDPLYITDLLPEAQIFYTLDASLAPGDEGWTPYIGAIYLEAGNNTVYAVAYDPEKGFSDVVSHTFLVSSIQKFELVKAGDKINESDRFIIVNAIPYPDPLDNYQESWYAMTTEINSASNKYLYGEKVEHFDAVGEDRPYILLPEHTTYPIAILNIVHDPSGDNAQRPYLIRVEGMTDQDGHRQYFKSTAKKVIDFVQLPEKYVDRSSMNVRIDISDHVFSGNYSSKESGEPPLCDYTGDYLDYGDRGVQLYYDYDKKEYKASSARTESLNAENKPRYGSLQDKAQIVFNGVATNVIRFNPTGKVIHFNAYNTDKPENTEVPFNSSTWPIQLYRATDVVFPPAITIYPSSVDYNHPDEIVYSDIEASPEREVFNNPVKIRIEQNPRTPTDATLNYAWSYSKQAAPAPEEYTTINSNSYELYVDGFEVTTIDNPEIVYITEHYYKNYDDETNREYLATPTIRAIAQIDADTYSRSLPRTIHFKTTAPIVRRISVNEVDHTETVAVERPEIYTLGATLKYSVNNEPEEEIERVGNNFKPITIASGSSLRVGAYKDGYEPTFTDYTANNYYTEIRPIQLLELTKLGKEKLGNTTRRYLTYRTGEFEHEHYYLIDDLGNGAMEIEFTPRCQDLTDVLSDPKYFNWTPNYYVMALNYTKMVSDGVTPNVVDGVPQLTVTVTDGADATATPIVATPETLTVPADGEFPEEERVYYGCIIDRDGQIGQRVMSVDLDYTVGTQECHTNSLTNVTPKMPKATVGYYRYRVHQYTQDEQHTQNLTKRYPGKDYLKFLVKSSVLSTLDPESGEPVYEDCEVLMPTSELDPRQLDCVISFERPNICASVLANYDIFYTLKFTNNLGETLAGGGVYSDTDEDHADSMGRYAFALNKVHPSTNVYPILTVENTRYVQNQKADDAYGIYTANLGSTLVIPAVNHTQKKPAEIKHILLGYATGSGYEINGHTPAEGTYDWMYKGHVTFEDEGDVIVDPTGSAMDRTGDEEFANDDPAYDGGKLTLNPSFYHIETYYDYSGGIDYSSYEYLVKHPEGHQSHLVKDDNGLFPVDDLGCIANDEDPLIGTFIARGFHNTVSGKTVTPPHVVISPVYIFWREANAEEGGDDLTPEAITSLTWINSVASNGAPARAPRKAPAKAPITSNGSATPDTSAAQPMIHQGYTDMNAANIQDLTASDEYVVVKGGNLDTTPSDKTLTGIENVAVELFDSNAVYYNLQGIRIINPQPGQIYIVRRGNTTTKEILR